MIKIDCNKIQKYGKRGFSITVPKVWIRDHGLIEGDSIDFYRDKRGRLILVANKQEQEKEKVEVK